MLKAAQFFWCTAAASVYGFDVGDRLMRDVSEKLCPLREIIGGFRFSGNRFVFLVQGSAGRSELIELAEQIRGRLEEGLDPIGHHRLPP